MTRFAIAVALLAGMVVAGSARAQAGADLEKAKGCPACHAATATRIGPSYKEIASRHRNDPATVEKLVAMLKEGKVHPRASGSDAELRSIVTFVLSTR
jgi:cytochrome c